MRRDVRTVLAVVALAPLLLAAAPADPSGQDEPAGMTPWTVAPAAPAPPAPASAAPAPSAPAPAAPASPPSIQPENSQPQAAQETAPADAELTQRIVGRWGQNPSCSDFFVEFRPGGLALMFEAHGRRKQADWGSFGVRDGELTINHITGAATHTHIHFDQDALVGQQAKRKPSRLVRCADQAGN